ncbi:MAG: ATP-binding protein [Caldimonas sp.]
MSGAAFVVVLLGAESTGKTTLAHGLAQCLAARGERVVRVDEVLREFCDAHGRTPRRDEQAGIAAQQTARIDAAAAAADIVVADTSALMIAIYSEIVFADTHLYASALAAQRQARLTLLTALDLPWREDGLQRDGPHVRAPVDALIRSSLAGAGIAFTTVEGHGPSRLDAALRAVDSARAARS